MEFSNCITCSHDRNYGRRMPQKIGGSVVYEVECHMFRMKLVRLR